MQNNTINIQKENDSLRIENKSLQLERDELKRQLAELKRMIFGSKRECFIPVDSSQMDLFEKIIAKKEKELEKYTVSYKRDKKTEELSDSDLTACPEKRDPKEVNLKNLFFSRLRRKILL